MKMLTLFLLSLISLSFAAPVFAKGKTPKSVIIESKDIQWAEVPGFPGVRMSTVEGDSAKGAHHSFMKFDAGFAAPLHHHTHNHFVTVVAGTLVLNVDGKDHNLPAGSYFQFKDKGSHKTSCAPGADCILFVDGRGKWDVMPEKQ